MSELGKDHPGTTYNLEFLKPCQFYSKNREQYNDWESVKMVILEEKDQKDKRQWRKNILYPNFTDRPEFCQEEFLAYQWYAKNKKRNEFTKRCYEVWQSTTTNMEQKVAEVKKKTKQKPSKVGRKEVQRNKKSNKENSLMPVSIMKYHDAENVPFSKPKSSIGSNFQSLWSALSPIENTLHIKSTRKIPVDKILTINESMASLSIHRGHHEDEILSSVLSSENNSSEKENEAVTLSPVKLNPFCTSFIDNLIKKVGAIEQLKKLQFCTFTDKVKSLAKDHHVEFGGDVFCNLKSLTKGGYGTLYSGRSKKTQGMFVLKQERPPNVWEFHLCLELQKRIRSNEFLPYFVSVTHGLIGENLSILAMPFSRFGSLIDINNLILKATNKFVDEIIVFHIAKQILTIIQVLHETQIIHADIKPDNFLVMRDIDLSLNPKPFIQLIDFGCAIDVKLVKQEFPNFNGFYGSLKNNPCIEMREGRPWIYQLDWYGVAFTIHALLFGEYMIVVRDKNGLWKPKMAIKRYFQKEFWEQFFYTLLQIKDNTKPDVKSLIKMIDQILLEKEKISMQSIQEFNKIIMNKK